MGDLEPGKEKTNQQIPVKNWGWKQRILLVVSLGIVFAYLIGVPGGLYDKADMVAYAICHRIPSHSFSIGGTPLPLCARCSGIFMGAMVAISFFVIKRRKKADIPSIPILLTLIGFTIIMGIDGINSYITLFPLGTPFYQPTNTLRLLTGTLHGLMLGSILYPVAMGTFWRDYRDSEPAIHDFKELGLLVLCALILVAFIHTGWTVVLQVLGLVSTIGVVVMLSLVNTVLILILTRRENRADSIRELFLPFLAGLALSLAMIGTIDLVRYAITGTMQSLPGLPK